MIRLNGDTIESTIVSLGYPTPVVNEEEWDCEPETFEGGEISWRFPNVPETTFTLSLTVESDTRISLVYRINNLPPNTWVHSFGISFIGVKNLQRYLRQGYHSWDGSYYVDTANLPADAKIPAGYGMTQLIPYHVPGSLIVGFTRHDRFQHKVSVENGTLTVQTMWDQRNADRIESERLVIFEHHSDDHEEALREWARMVADEMHARPAKERIIGWCSWYNLYANITEENIREHLHSIADVSKRVDLPMRVFQIDDGFTPEMGDWLDVKPQFPRGMKPLLDEIREAGFTPGLWIAPFLVGNRSKLYRDHPDWVVKTFDRGKPLIHMKFYGEFRWHKRSEEYYVLDTTHPDAFEYLRQVFRTWRGEWGCDYFKTDFMNAGSDHSPANGRAVWHTPGLTRIEIWRRTAEMIREEIGDALWVGCGCPLWASVGLVDAIRIGRDMGVEWHGDGYVAQALLRDQMTRNFGNGILWQADPDCIVMRHDYTEFRWREKEALAIYAAMAGGVTMTSDKIDPRDGEFWRMLVGGDPGVPCRYPLLGRSPALYRAEMPENRGKTAPLDPFIVQVREGRDITAVFILNAGDTHASRTFPLSLLGIPSPRYVVEWQPFKPPEKLRDALKVDLKPHSGVLFYLSATPLPEGIAHLPLP